MEPNLILPGQDSLTNQLAAGVDPITGRQLDRPDPNAYTPPTRSGIEGVKELGKYDAGFRYGMNQEYNRGANQSGFSKIVNGALSRTASVVTKTAQGAGHVLGFLWDTAEAGHAAMTGEERENFFEHTYDNAISNLFSSLDEELKQQLPVHMSKEYAEGNLLNKMITPEFWANDVFDGIAFMASAFVPGAVGGKLFGGIKSASSLAKGTQVGKAIESLKVAVPGLNTKTAALTIYNTISEAGFEAKEINDSVRADLRRQHPDMSEEEINQRAGEAASRVFSANVAALIAPNFIQTQWFGMGKKFNVDKIRQSVRGGTKAAEEITGKYAIWKEGVKGFLSEGAWEENIQTAVQQYEGRGY